MGILYDHHSIDDHDIEWDSSIHVFMLPYRSDEDPEVRKNTMCKTVQSAQEAVRHVIGGPADDDGANKGCIYESNTTYNVISRTMRSPPSRLHRFRKLCHN